MPIIRFALSILVLPFAFHSIQAQGTTQPAEVKTGTATVSGRVTMKGEPARGVMVILQAQNPGTANSPRARADENGRFSFSGVAAGKYWISALAPGYVSPGDAQTLNVAEGDKVENIDIEIRRGGVIAGRISDSHGRPVIEETITLSKLDSNNRPQNYSSRSPNFDNSRTDDRGDYRIYGLPEGRYLVSVGYSQSPGLARIASRREFYPRVFYPKASSESEAKVIEVREGLEATDIDITVPDPKRTHDVYGRVVDASDGQPVAGVEVVVGGLPRDGRLTGTYTGSGVRSGPNGEFRLFGVLPGKYSILIRHDDPVGFISDPVIIDISEGDATGVEIRVRQGASISGVAIIQGTNDPKVLAKLSEVNLEAIIRSTGLYPLQSLQKRFVRVSADGSFRINGLHAGKASITTWGPGDLRGFKVGRVERNGAPAPEGIELDPGEHVTGVRVILIYGTLTLRGAVKIVGGAFPAGQRFIVSARRVDLQNGSGVEIDAREQFVIENLAPGEYVIRVVPKNSERLDPQIIRHLISLRERVVVAGGNQQPVTLVIDLSRTVSR